MTDAAKKTMLLHSCCGPCSTAVIARLVPQYDLTVFFYNPNITDAEEYELRKAEQIRFLHRFCEEHGAKIRFEEGEYEPSAFLNIAAGLESEPEGGRRCSACFHLRLLETARRAAQDGFHCFDTTLTVSPRKDAERIHSIGTALAKTWSVDFCGGNYKKKDGFSESVAWSRRYELYRQNYCGCDFSRRDR